MRTFSFLFIEIHEIHKVEIHKIRRHVQSLRYNLDNETATVELNFNIEMLYIFQRFITINLLSLSKSCEL